ncbi:TetR family transcriptional regulator [Pseudonocardia kunmingensis]|uniref:TetR family transcriptional regulator n=1 Tax=Pseudonocardia kunmingensis TaxID=630975 RepID=A0A543DAE3_9PSEU|nr:TetR family transcriptional regulator [Pseudonocardia kunmingensis]
MHATTTTPTGSSARSEVEHIALDLFTERGFDTTTVDDIAAAAGIGRRTVFRYCPSKNDIPWGATPRPRLPT